MYVEPNFKTKKALKEAVAAGRQVTVFQPNDMFGKNAEVAAAEDITVTIEGPHYPQAHQWYARVRCSNGVVQEVLS